MSNTNPVFSLTMRADAIILNTATVGVRTNGSTGSSSLMSTGANGTKITQIWAKSMVANGVTSTALTIFIYYGTTAGGAASATLYDEIILPAVAAASTTPSARAINFYNDFQLPTGYSIWVSSSVRTDLNAGNVPNVVVGISAGDV